MNDEMDRAEPEPLFRCKVCGCEELNVIRRFTRSTHCEDTVACDCGDEEFAAVRRYRIDVLCEQTGSLDDDHHFDLDAAEELEQLGIDDEEYEVHCSACLEDADETCWESDPYQVEVEETDDEFYVQCQGCGWEVEFGWSHPDRGGRIWPAECADFNPWRSWPEPRFTESWHHKGWLRPIPAKDVAQSLGCSVETVEELLNSGKLARHPKSRDLATDSFALKR